MKINFRLPKLFTHEGAHAKRISPEQELRRSVLACLLWESGFYEDGVSVAERIRSLVPRCAPEAVMEMAVHGRKQANLRHAPLLLLRELARHPKKPKIASALAEVIQRADELTEFLALYWMEGKCPLTRQVKLGLGWAFQKFDAYQLAKYDRRDAIKLRDVLFMVHAKPKDEEQAALWRKLVQGELAPPDTWEVALSGGEDKKEAFTRLLREKKLGYLALMRNMRNMDQAGVDDGLIASAIKAGAGKSKVLPFRFIAAARATPRFEPWLDEAMQNSMAEMDKLKGITIVLVDVSGSMDDRLSRKSDLNRIDAAAALSALVVGIADTARVFTFSESVVEVPPRRGMALVDAIMQSQPHYGTYLGEAVKAVQGNRYDRLIVITDEQSADPVPDPTGKGYMINVATYKNGLGYGKWTHIDGFSESIVKYIQAVEN